MSDKAFLSWGNHEYAIRMLATTIEEHEDPDTIVGVARGGLPGAVMLSHMLEAEMVAVEANLYEGEDRGDEVTVGDFTMIPEGDVLIFDDVVDSGETMKEVYRMVDDVLGDGNGLTTAAINVKPDRKIDPEYWVEETDEWVVYPWEE